MIRRPALSALSALVGACASNAVEPLSLQLGGSASALASVEGADPKLNAPFIDPALDVNASTRWRPSSTRSISLSSSDPEHNLDFRESRFSGLGQTDRRDEARSKCSESKKDPDLT
jgi:hypothetical protein